MTPRERDEREARTELDDLVRQFKGYPPARIASEVWLWTVKHGMTGEAGDPRISTLHLDLTYDPTVAVSRCPDCALVATAKRPSRAVQMVREHLVEDHGVARPRRHLRKSRRRA